MTRNLPRFTAELEKLDGELKCCPFCGGEAELVIDGDHHGEFYKLGCKNESCIGSWAYYTESPNDTPIEKAAAAWNTRAAPEAVDALRESVALVKELVGVLRSAPLESPSGTYLKRYEAILDLCAQHGFEV